MEIGSSTGFVSNDVIGSSIGFGSTYGFGSIWSGVGIGIEKCPKIAPIPNPDLDPAGSSGVITALAGMH